MAGFWLQNNNIFLGGRDELRTCGASLIFGGHRMTLGCSGLHANCYLLLNRNSPTPKIIYAEIALP